MLDIIIDNLHVLRINSWNSIYLNSVKLLLALIVYYMKNAKRKYVLLRVPTTKAQVSMCINAFCCLLRL